MRRETRRYQNGGNKRKMIYLGGSILSVAILAFAVTYFSYQNIFQSESLGQLDSEKLAELMPQQNQVEDTESASSSIGKTVEESKQEEEEAPKIAINTSNMETEKQKETPKITNTEDTNTKENEEKKETADLTFVKPVEGEILKAFAKDNLVFSQTLNEWTTHNGIDIKADNTTVVHASAEGTVKSIKNDPRYGLTIILEHEGGFTTTYANLLSTEFVVEGEKVEQGQTIGTVGNTAMFEIADESHLHFEIAKDGLPQDPTLYLK